MMAVLATDADQAWPDDPSGSGTARAASAPRPTGKPGEDGAPMPPTAVRADDARRRLHLERVFGIVPEHDAEVLVVDLADGASLPVNARTFEGALLVLSNQADRAGMLGLAGILPRAAPPSQLRAAAAALAEGLSVRLATHTELDREPSGFGPPDYILAPPLSPAHDKPAELALRAMPARILAQPGFAERDAPSTGRSLLTPRELETLALVGEGLSNKAIARRLSISAHTVKYHLEAVFEKLGARSRAEAVSRGLRQGLLVV